MGQLNDMGMGALGQLRHAHRDPQHRQVPGQGYRDVYVVATARHAAGQVPQFSGSQSCRQYREANGVRGRIW
jgi:hypothetical protein